MRRSKLKSVRTGIITLLVCFLSGNVHAQHADDIYVNDTLSVRAVKLFKDNFKKGLRYWHVEQMVGGTATVKEGALEIEDVSGCTIWFNKLLQAPMMITYDAVVIKAGGDHDRVSDLNCFWLATDPWHPDNFFREDSKRNGKFGTYDSLKLYYVGLGGHNNSKTRFRKYAGDGTKPLLPQHDLSDIQYLIVPNVVNKIKIIVYGTVVQYYINEKLVFDFYDSNPLTTGYFALRTVNNHMTVDNFKVFTLKKIIK